MDWRNGAGFPYTQATANIRVVGAQLAKLIEFIMQENPAMSAEDIHMIGHSLGAHGASEVGTKIKGIGRISGNVVMIAESKYTVSCILNLKANTLYFVSCTLYFAPCTLHLVLCTLYFAPFTVRPVLCTLYPVAVVVTIVEDFVM